MENKGKRTPISISLSKGEKDLLMEKAQTYGLSLSAFLRLAALEYIEKHKEGRQPFLHTRLAIKNYPQKDVKNWISSTEKRK